MGQVEGRQMSAPELASTIKALLLYALEHFAYEEKLMADLKWPGLEVHRKMHTSFKEKCTGLAALAMQPGGVSTDVVVKCIAGYLREQVRDPVYGDVAFVKFAHKG
jgi:hemerythrin